MLTEWFHFRDGKFKGMAYIDFETEKAANSAVETMNSFVLRDFTVKFQNKHHISYMLISFGFFYFSLYSCRLLSQIHHPRQIIQNRVALGQAHFLVCELQCQEGEQLD